MMNIPPSEAKRLSLWEYEAILAGWNEAHSTDPDVPDGETVQRVLDAANLDPRLIN